jgi:transcriptional regulator with XRE-family HTH domain
MIPNFKEASKMFEFREDGNWFEHNRENLDGEIRARLEEIKKSLELAEESANMEKFNELREHVKEYDFKDTIILEELEKDFARVERAINRSVSWTFAYLLRYYRREKGISLKELKEETGITASYINRLERGYKKAPSLGIVEKLADALDIPVHVLLGGTKEDIENKDISEIFFNEHVTFLGKELGAKQRVALLDILNFVIGEENWKNNFTAGIKLIDLVDKFHIDEN